MKELFNDYLNKLDSDFNYVYQMFRERNFHEIKVVAKEYKKSLVLLSIPAFIGEIYLLSP